MAHPESAISRRRFVQTTAAGSLALAGIGFGRSTWAQSIRPNIVFIMADDLGYADVSCYGQRDYTTSNKEPFLISLHFTAPHWPWEGPGDEAESKRIRNIFHRDGGTQRTYAAMVQSLDVNIGRVLHEVMIYCVAGQNSSLASRPTSAAALGGY